MSGTDPPAGPQPGVAAWVPDPGGRHQLRWWDGRAYTAVVADGGVRSVEPLPGAPLGPPPAAPPSWTAPDPFAAPAAMPGAVPGAPVAPVAPVAPGGGGRRWILVGAVAAVVLVAVAVLALATDPFEGEAGGTGTFEGQASAGEPGVHDVSVGPGQVLLVTVAPDGDLDAVVGLLVDDAAADHLEDLYGEVAGVSPATDAFGAEVAGALDDLDEDRDGGARVVALRSDLDFAGGDETLLLVATEDVEGTLVVAPFGDDAGSYTIEVERIELELDADELGDADGRDLLDAVIEAGAPPGFTELARDLRELLDEQDEAAAADDGG